MESYKYEQVTEILSDNTKWPRLRYDDEIVELITGSVGQLGTRTVYEKIASILMEHQLLDSALRHLIKLSILYIQGEIWPAKYEPVVHAPRDQKTTGWYLNYYEKSCLDVESKTDFLDHMKKMNSYRNKIAHHIIGKNEVIISDTHEKFSSEFYLASQAFSRCEKEVFEKLYDLTKRVNFNGL